MRLGYSLSPGDPVRRERLRFALEPERRCLAQLGICQPGGDPLGEDDLSPFCLALEPGRRVDDVADGGEVVKRPLADVADEGLAEVEPDPSSMNGPCADP